ncbi:hypothetical protein Taro_011225 [Colocasia esculenta]|uniref:Neprosin PEP catalytic domain-containing protein n=1 Tax=Colocasia esculenta TaxID=4460 RepID=A0A843U5N7_COLES|nr:hypothetical protein [Colocasia esculenta]
MVLHSQIGASCLAANSSKRKPSPMEMRPTYHPNEGNGYVTEASHPWNLSRSCPQGSIPIQRSLRNGSIKNISSTSHWQRGPQYFSGQRVKQKLLGADTSVHEHSSIQAHESTYYGAKATINVWNPKLETQDESSLAQIWVVSQDRMTTLEAGWMVQPRLYGTDETRFFTYWTSDGYKNGCYNIECPGFVQTNHQTTISSLLRPVSVYGGQQYAIDVEIFKDKATGNWWLLLQGVQLGYWPKELVPSLANGAGMIYWGGEIAYNQAGAHTSTQMGSGHYSYEGFQKASFFRNVQGMDTSYAYNTPRNFDVKAENGRCYDLQVGGNKDGSWGLFFFYGGPGRSDKCS